MFRNLLFVLLMGYSQGSAAQEGNSPATTPAEASAEQAEAEQFDRLDGWKCDLEKKQPEDRWAVPICRDGAGGSFVMQEVQRKKFVPPHYPDAARNMFGSGVQGCEARIVIDKKGRPLKVEIGQCATVFHEPTRRALMKWRFYPQNDEHGQKIEAQYFVRIKYELD